MKYMIMMFGEQASMMEMQSTEWIKDMIQFMHELNDDLTKSGELVSAEGLVDGSQTRTVRFTDGAPVATDGPFAESKESMVGFWIVDVEDEDRAVAIAAHVVGFTHGPIEVRQVGEPPEL
jgi:hypothetical protein